MIILEKPFISESLINTIVQNDWAVLDNEILDNIDLEEDAFEVIPSEIAKGYYEQVEHPLIYSNSENAINWILENIPDSNLSKYIKLFKNKIEFRKMLASIYPDFYYKEVRFGELEDLEISELKFPLVLKPSVGFLSYGVHTIQNEDDWNNALKVLDAEMKQARELYSEEIVDSSMFILEEYINGEEFAIDAYFDKDGNPVILNIFQHPFLNSKDVRDRIYIMSAGIMVKYMSKFAILLKNIGEKNDIKNFPLHMEVRILEDETIVPIEINPMRFAGWCTTDVAQYAWGINVYECFMKQTKPNWNEILEKAHSGVYYFSMAEIEPDVDRNKIQSFDYEGYLSNFSNVLELRRINPKNNPLFAVIFGQTNNKEEIKNILQLSTKDYTKMAE